MMQDVWNAPPGFRPTKSAPCSPAKPLGGISRTRSESFHATNEAPVGDTPYVRARNVQKRIPGERIPLFWAAINAGDRVDSALKDMAIVMKQQNWAEEAIEAINSLRHRCSDQAQESLDNILLDLYKRCGRLEDQITLLKHKLFFIRQGLAFNGKRTKTARSQGKKFQVSVEQEANRLLGNLGWALMQQGNYIEAEDAYRQALAIAPDNNKMCNMGICLMKQGRISEAKETLQQVRRQGAADGRRGVDSHLKAYERAQQMLKDLESERMSKGRDNAEQCRLFDTFFGSSSIWQPQPCKHHACGLPATKAVVNQFNEDCYTDENANSSLMLNRMVMPPSLARESIKQVVPHGNSLYIAAQPFYSSNVMKETKEMNQFHETLKRTRFINATDATKMDAAEIERIEINTKRLSSEENGNPMGKLLPDNKDFQDVILATVLGPANEERKTNAGILQKNVENRLKVFQDITLSFSPRA